MFSLCHMRLLRLKKKILDPNEERNGPILDKQFGRYNWFVEQLFSTNGLPGGASNASTNPSNSN
jgi:hypothetical protein